jgi:hypothetical protein
VVVEGLTSVARRPPGLKTTAETENSKPMAGRSLDLQSCLPANRDTCTAMFIAALFIIAKLWNQLRRLSTDEWIIKT